MLIDPSRVRVRGPLAPFATGFAEELGRQGYTPLSARNQMWLMAQLSRWLLSEGIDAADLSASDVDRFLCARRAAGCRKLRSIKATRPILAYLYELDVARPPSAPEPASAVEVMLALSHLSDG